MAAQPTTRRSSAWVLIAVTLLLALAIGGAVLVGSGIVKLPVSVDNSASPSASAQESVAATSSPAEPVPASWTATGDMVEARTGHTATQLLDGRVLVAGGVGEQISEGIANILASAELYDPSTGQWTGTGEMLEIRGAHTAVLLPDGRVLVLGGSACSDFDGCPLFSAELYDPTTGTWAATQGTTAGGPARTATLLDDGSVLVVGGSVGSLSEDTLEPIDVAEIYDPGTGQWSATGPLVEALNQYTATKLVGGRVLVLGGTTAQLYDPDTGQWTAAAPMAGVHVGHSATLLPNGQVLVTGGMAGTGSSDIAELYDPVTEQWIATGNLREARLNHTATLLADGRVLVLGGVNSVIDAGVARESAELYDPATGQWTATEFMAVTRLGFSATLLGDGTVLVSGGAGGGFEALASAELYDPGSGS